MTWYAELAPCTYFPAPDACRLVAVGWLEAGYPIPGGSVADGLVDRLEALVAFGWQPIRAAGWHDCSLCGRGPTDGPLYRRMAGRRRILGVDNLFVPIPAGDRNGPGLYVAPSLILHYIEAHAYRPPPEFVRAVDMVDPRSAGYVGRCERLWSGAADTHG